MAKITERVMAGALNKGDQVTDPRGIIYIVRNFTPGFVGVERRDDSNIVGRLRVNEIVARIIKKRVRLIVAGHKAFIETVKSDPEVLEIFKINATYQARVKQYIEDHNLDVINGGSFTFLSEVE